jgi:hypothetical protein
LILGDGGDIFFQLKRLETVPVMFTWQMQWQLFEEVAISPEPGTGCTLRRERKMFASDYFHKSPHCFIGIHLAIVIYEQLVVY